MLQKRTKIVCTIGPASSSTKIICGLVKAGMNVARINFSHGTPKSNGVLIKKIRECAKKLNTPIAILADLQGPRIRLGVLPKEGVVFKKGDKIKLDVSLKDYKNNKIPVSYKNLIKDLKAGHRILLDDGKMELIVKKIQGSIVEAEVKVGGVLSSHKGINLPDSVVSISALTEKDKEDLRFLVKAEVEYIGLSFVKEARDILKLRSLIKKLEKKQEPEVKIIAKIEKHEAIKNIESIIESADGIMVARGDLGLEMPAEEVPLWQKQIISKCLKKARPVIVATQMLDSMTHNPRPTRAEVSDVANAVIDHADAVMLSGETASGEFPIETVRTMAKIIEKTETSVFDDLELPKTIKNEKTDVILSGLSRLLAEEVGAKAILAASISGDTGRHISSFRPELPIFVATDSLRVCRQLNLSWGVISFVLLPCQTVEELIRRSVVYLKNKKLMKKKDKLIIIAGEPVGHAGQVNLVEVKEI